MKTICMLCILLLFFSSDGFGQVASITAFSSHLGTEVEQINTLATIGQLEKAIERLNNLNRYIEHTVNFEFEEMVTKARHENPDFKINFGYRLQRELTSVYWQDKYDRASRAYRNSRDAMSGLSSMRTLDRQDVAWAYLKTTYDAVKTIRDVVVSYGKQDYLDALKSAKDGIDSFIENYQQIEEAHLQGIKTDLMEVQMNGLARRAKKTLDQVEPILSYMKANAEEGDRFQKLLAKANGISDGVTAGKVVKLDFGDPRYTWNYGPYQKELEGSCRAVRDTQLTCDKFRKTFQEIKSRAQRDWQKISATIKASNDEEQKPKFLQWHQESWDDFTGVVTPLFDKAYSEQCRKSVATPNSTTPSTDSTPYGGVKKSEPKKVTRTTVSPDDDSTLYAGVTQKGKQVKTPDPANTSTKKTPAENRPPVPAAAPPQGGTSSDKFWTNAIPADASREWVGPATGMGIEEYRVRFTRNGRTVGYRNYYDPFFKRPRNEYVMDSLAVFHGPARTFDYSANGMRLSTLCFYRANRKTGPEARFGGNGSVASVKYFIDDREISETEYKNRARSEKALPPYDIHEKAVWRDIPTDSDMPDPPKVMDTAGIDYHQLTIPRNAVAFLSIQQYKDGPFTYGEKYYLPESHSSVGERTWTWGNEGPVLIRESVRYGNKGIIRSWKEDGTFETAQFFYRENGIMGDFYRVGPQGAYDQYWVPGDKRVGLAEYRAELKRNPQLPDPAMFDLITRTRPVIAPGSYPAAEGIDRIVRGMGLPAGAGIWSIDLRGSMPHLLYYQNRSIVGEFLWHDRKMTQPADKKLFAANLGVFNASWSTSGRPKSVYLRGGHTKNIVACQWNEDGSMRKLELSGITVVPVKKVVPLSYDLAIRKFPNTPPKDDINSPNLQKDTGPPKIPGAEQTPLFARVWGKEPTIFTGSPLLDTAVRDVPEPARDNPADTADFRQLQRQEFLALGEEINKKLTAADKAFDRPYWQGTFGATTTLQATNPKQESLDILRSAIPLIERAKYPENTGALYHLVAMKLINYSGRVFAFKAKQDFFQLAAQLVEKADRLLPKNRYVKGDLADAYCTSAEVWRSMTRTALWGSHPYNKMECDKKVIQQYERALQIAPNNSKAKRMLAQLKAPKKAVPATVQKIAEIEEQTWNDVQALMAQMEKGRLEREKVEQQVNPIDIAEMTLGTVSGKVQIKRAGSDRWADIEDPLVVIYPGDAIKTGPDAKGVSVTYAQDKAYLALKSDAEVTFQDESTLLISRGGSYVRVTKKGTKFLVVSPTAAVGVRGTQFEVQVGDDKTTETYLYEGVVETRNGSDIDYLVAGQKGTAVLGESRLQQTSFDAQARLKSTWNDLESRMKRHAQVRAQAPRSGKGTVGTATLVPPPALQGKDEAGRGSTSAVSTGATAVSFSWSPSGTFSPVMVDNRFHYGTYNLIARLPVKVAVETPVTVNWYRNGTLISTGRHVISPQSEHFDGQIVTGGEPIHPGSYRVEFITDTRMTAKGEVEIIAPQQVDRQTALQNYAVALQTMQQALSLVEQGDLFNAGIKASSVLNDLRQVLYSDPTVPDIQSVTEMCLALMSFTEMIHATNTNQMVPANEWVQRSLGHARRSDQLCQDAQFKMSTQRILTALETVFSEFNR